MNSSLTATFGVALVLATSAFAQTTLGNGNPREFTTPTGSPLTFLFAAPDQFEANLYVTPGPTTPFELLQTFPITATTSGPSELTAAVQGTEVYFASDEGLGFGDELWRSDGTVAGTNRVRDIRVGPSSSRPQQITAIRADLVLFTADDGIHGRELWKTDGSLAGTMLVKDIRLGADGAVPLELIKVGQFAFFAANDGIDGRELWMTDGTTSGTTLAANLAPGAAGSFPSSLTLRGSELLFAADDGTVGNELWKINTMTLATTLIADIDTTGDSRPRELTPAGNDIYFVAEQPGIGAELWTTDGTPSGTQLVFDIHPTAGVGSNPHNLRAGLMSLWFAADDGTTGIELWHTDLGTNLTTQVADIATGADSSRPQQLVMLNSAEILFTADDGVLGRELWRAGTASATLVDDLLTGPCNSGITSLTGSAGAGVATPVLFAAETDDGLGHELYATDGTAIGTTLVGEINLFPDTQPLLDLKHAIQSGQNLNDFKVSGLEPGSSAFLMFSVFSGPPVDFGPPLGLQSDGRFELDPFLFIGSTAPVLADAAGVALFPTLPYALTAPGFEITTQALGVSATAIKFTDGLSVCQGTLDLSSLGCSATVELAGRYIDDRLDYCLSVKPSSEEVTWVVLVKRFPDGSCKELDRYPLTGSATTITVVKSLKLGEFIEARFFCDDPNDDCADTSGYVACRLGC